MSDLDRIKELERKAKEAEAKAKEQQRKALEAALAIERRKNGK